MDVVKQTGLCVAAQSADLAPADRVLYELRDVTGTVESIPLIAASVMSKKLAAGADCILLDVKCGDGAFMKTLDDAQVLADAMVAIGRGAGRSCDAIVSGMDSPLGLAVGNALEVAEAVEVLRGRGSEDLYDCCLELTDGLLKLAAERSSAVFPNPKDMLSNGSAYSKFIEMIAAQGGDASVLSRGFPPAPFVRELKADRSGLLVQMDAEAVGRGASLLGAGRRCKGDPIDHAAGIVLYKKPGTAVSAGECLCELHASEEALFPAAEEELRGHMIIKG
jgi:pyrimidine-nucleoside phosphorylase